jgi:DedD protein
METRLKERLTGAAILVALIVMLVPEMFRGDGDHDGPSGVPATTGSSGAEGPPLRSYTIDLSNNPKGAAPLQSNGDATAANPKSEPAGSDASKAEPPKAEAPRTESPKAEPPRAEPPRQAPARPETASTAPAPSKAAPAAAPAASVRNAQATSGGASVGQPKAALAASTANSGNWNVQLGLFAKRENAERLVNELKAKGFTAAISGADPKGLFHVHCAGTSDRATAQALAQRLKGEGFQAVVAP